MRTVGHKTLDWLLQWILLIVPSAKQFPFIFLSNRSDLRRLVILMRRVQVLYGLLLLEGNNLNARNTSCQINSLCNTTQGSVHHYAGSSHVKYWSLCNLLPYFTDIDTGWWRKINFINRSNNVSESYNMLPWICGNHIVSQDSIWYSYNTSFRHRRGRNPSKRTTLKAVVWNVVLIWPLHSGQLVALEIAPV